ncbi:hypothetical protein B7C42_08131 [Nocardia cerradoensis]|uniref:Uncharacterized protein n=1 Tax=Nocardia cerradoensis TaxID=85688 RepID=A0A231GT96_9NOCA|nr:hypothetical protein [Nocardia cerradoensis]OXR39802.1 hypothetical protein B7C42_08131 [Nocardia cerradoensis]
MATSYAPRSGLRTVQHSAVSILGEDMHVREFVHDARHFMVLACH